MFSLEDKGEIIRLVLWCVYHRCVQSYARTRAVFMGVLGLWL